MSAIITRGLARTAASLTPRVVAPLAISMTFSVQILGNAAVYSSLPAIALHQTPVRGMKLGAHFTKLRKESTKKALEEKQSKADEELFQFVKSCMTEAKNEAAIGESAASASAADSAPAEEVETKQTDAKLVTTGTEVFLEGLSDKDRKKVLKTEAGKKFSFFVALFEKTSSAEDRLALAESLLQPNPPVTRLLSREVTHVLRAMIEIGGEAWRTGLRILQAERNRGGKFHVEENTYRALATLLESAQQWEATASVLEAWRVAFPAKSYNRLGEAVYAQHAPYELPDLLTFVNAPSASTSAEMTKAKKQARLSHAQSQPFSLSPAAGKALLRVVELRREAGTIVSSPTLEVYYKHLLSSKRSEEALKDVYSMFHQQKMIPSGTLPGPLDPVVVGEVSRPHTQQFTLSSAVLTDLAVAAEAKGNYSAALTILAISRTLHNDGEDIRPVRGVVQSLVPQGSKPQVLPSEAVDTSLGASRANVGTVRDFFDVHAFPVPSICTAIYTNLVESRIRKAFAKAIAAAATKPQTFIDWQGFGAHVPVVASADVARWELLTDRCYAVPEEGKPAPLTKKHQTVSDYLASLVPPVQSSVVIGESKLDAKVVVDAAEVAKWLDATAPKA